MQSAPAHQRYRFGTHVIRTEIDLQALPRADRATPGGVIEVIASASGEAPAIVDAWLHHWYEDGGSARVLSLARHGDGYRLRFPGLCDFLLDAGAGHITAEPLDGLEPDTFEHLLIDQVLPRLLAHRGELVAHASAVRIGDRTALFLGRSGWGKSTLAGLLHRAGHRLLSDDCALLRMDDRGVTAVPTYPSLRMYDDSISQTVGTGGATASVAGYSQKRRVAVADATADGAARQVHAIYLLNDPAAPVTRHGVDPLPPAVACMAIVEHSFRLDMTSTAHTTALLRQAAGVLQRIPAFSLRYPRDYTSSSQLIQMVEQHVGGLEE